MTQKNIWENKVAIVTGGSSGIGRATALALVTQGANVLITGRSAEKLANVTAANPNLHHLQADSADPANCANIIKEALGKWGRLDLIVNNAGAGQPMQIEAYNAETITNMCITNITSPSLMIKEGRAALRETKGAVVNIGTAVSQNAAPSLAHYAATKTALESLTKSWAIEMAGDGIRVNMVAPGPVKSGALTGMMGLPENMAEKIERQEAAQVPLGRRGTPDDIAPWILKLGASDNEWLTGQTLTVDGGWASRS